MSDPVIPIVKLAFKQDLKALNDAIAGYQSRELQTAQEVLEIFKDSAAGLVIASLHKTEDLIQIATLVKMAKKIPNTSLRIVVINFSGNRQFEKAAAKLGILDIMEPNVSAKAFRFKVDFWIKSMKAQIQKSSNAATVKTIKTLENKAAEKKQEEKSYTLLDPLDSEEDIWLLNKESDCKKILSRWMVKLVGPSPYVGQWVDVNKPNIWKFEITKDQRETFLTGKGDWFFRGDNKPEFIWKENCWLITGESFDLFYYDTETQTRLKLKDKALFICANSEFAKFKSKFIQDSFNKDLVFKKDADHLKDQTLDIDGNDQISKNLEGKGKTEQLNGDPLSGKTKGEEAINTDPMSLALKPGENQKKAMALEQKSETEKLDRNWNGKNSGADKIDSKGQSGPAGERGRDGELLDLENKKHDHETYYKGHLEAEKFEASEKKKNQYKEENKDGALSGKSDTDHIPKHYHDKPETNKKSDAHAKAESELAGKSHTDKLPSHYGNKQDQAAASAQKKETEAELAGKSNTDKLPAHFGKKPGEASDKKEPDSDLSGKSSTDKLASQLGKKPGEAAEKKENDKDLAGKSSTDKMPSHLGQKTSENKDKKDSEAELGGKSSTDKLASHYGKKKDPAPEEAKAEKKRFDRESLESTMADLTKADKDLGERKTREQSEKTASEKNLKDPKHRTEAEKLEKDLPAARKLGPEKEAKDLAGKSSTDKLSAHYTKKDKAPHEEAAERTREKAEQLAPEQASRKRELDEKTATAAKGAVLTEEDLQDLVKKHLANQVPASVQDHKKNEQDLSDKNNDLSEDLFAELTKTQKKSATSELDESNVLPLVAKEKAVKVPAAPLYKETEAELKVITANAKVVAYLVQDMNRYHCQLDDFFDESIIFRTERTGVKENENVKLDLSFIYLDKTTKIDFEGMITEYITEKGTSYITVKLAPENIVAFDTFMKLYSSRQENVNEFLKQVKGF